MRCGASSSRACRRPSSSAGIKTATPRRRDFDPPGGWTPPGWLIADDVIVAEAWQVELEEKKLLMYRGSPAPDPDDDDDDYSTERPAAIAGPGTAPNQAPAAYANGAPPCHWQPPRLPPGAQPPGSTRRAVARAPAEPCPRRPTPTSRAWSCAGSTKTRTCPRVSSRCSPTKTIRTPSSSGAPSKSGTSSATTPTGTRSSASRSRGPVSTSRSCRSTAKRKSSRARRSSKARSGTRSTRSSFTTSTRPPKPKSFSRRRKIPYVGVLGQFKTMSMEWAEANTVPRGLPRIRPRQRRRAARAAAAAAAVRARDAGAHDRRGRGERRHQGDDGPVRSLARRRDAERRFGFRDRPPAAAGRDRDLSLFRQLHALDVVWLSHPRRPDPAHL